MRKKIALILALTMCSLSVLSGCGKRADDTDTADTAAEESVSEEDETSDPIEQEEESSPDEEELISDQEESVESNLPDPTFIQTDENCYTVIIDCPDNSDAPELQAAWKYSFVENSEIVAGVSSVLVAAIVAAGFDDGKKNGQIDFDAYKDYVIPIYDYAFHSDIPAVFTDDPEAYSDIMTVTRDAYENFDDGYQYIMPLMVQETLAATDYNLTCGLARMKEGPVKWEQMMQDLEAATGLSSEETYAKYDAKFVYETLGLEYPGYAEEVISMVSSDVIYAAIVDDEGSYVTYTFDRT